MKSRRFISPIHTDHLRSYLSRLTLIIWVVGELNWPWVLIDRPKVNLAHLQCRESELIWINQISNDQHEQEKWTVLISSSYLIPMTHTDQNKKILSPKLAWAANNVYMGFERDINNRISIAIIITKNKNIFE